MATLQVGKNHNLHLKQPNEAKKVFLDELEIGVDVNNINGRYLSIDFLFSDKKGNVMHCFAKSNIAHCFVNKLHEGMVYSIKGFIVQPNKDKYRIMKDKTYILELQGSTNVTKTEVAVDGFIRYPFQFLHFEDIRPIEKKYLFDVIGYLTTVGKPGHQRTGSNTVDFNLINQRGRWIKVILWGKLGDDLIKKKCHNSGVYAIILTSMSAKNYINELCLSSSSSTLILDDHRIPALKEFKAEISDVNPNEESLPIMQVEPKDGSSEQLLRWAREKKDDVATFRCKMEITNVWTKNSWYYLTCAGGKCKKGVSRKDGNFWCDSCATSVSFPQPRFRLQIDVKDESGSTVIVLFDETAEKLANTTAKALLDGKNEDIDEDSTLPNALANLIDRDYIFEIKSNTYYNHGSYESFNCVRAYPAQISNAHESATIEMDKLEETFNKDMSGNDNQVPESSKERMKILKRVPTIATPSKASKRKNEK